MMMFFRQPSEQDKKIAFEFAKTQFGEDYVLKMNDHLSRVAKEKREQTGALQYTQDFRTAMNIALKEIDERKFIDDNSHLIYVADYETFKGVTKQYPIKIEFEVEKLDYEYRCSKDKDTSDERIRFLKFISGEKENLLNVKW